MILYLFALLTFVHCEGGLIKGDLNITGIRLVDGSGPYQGRVELRVKGIWGTICSDLFDINDAEVLCRMLNLSATWYDDNAWYGRRNGPIFATNLRCNGYETHLNQCRYDLSTNCTHWEDVSILCTKPSTPITDIRLTDGVGLYDGRVEIQMNGTWGDVCYDSFTRTEASAICNILFNLPWFDYGSDLVYGYNNYVHLNELNCDGDETDIQECNFELETPCPHNRRAYVICDGYPLNITDIRLVNGTEPYNGRVELKYKDQWGTICNFWMYNNAGNTLCRMLNSSLTAYFSTAKFGQGTGPVLFGGVLCSSDAAHLNDCYYPIPAYKGICDHDRDTSLLCTDCGLPSILNGEITSSNGSIMTVTCDTGYVPTTYTIECLDNGTWLQNETCEIYGYPLNITDMRLADGIGLYDGRLEVKVNNTWGTVCAGSFSYYEAVAICNMFNSTYYSYTTSSYYASGSGPIYIDQLYCVGSETHINQCKYTVLNTCSHSDDIAVICNGAPLKISDIRLSNGTGPHSGIVELLVDGTWGTICNYNLGLNEAMTLCNMMNLSLVSYYKTPVYGIGSGPTHISALSCNGNYNDINQCSYRTPTKHLPDNCTKHNDLSVDCTDNRLNISGLRLSPGPYHGRLEIQVNGTWGTVCDNSFDINDGQVICRMMNGLTVRQVYGGAYFGEGTGPIHIDEMTCSGNEPDINHCSYIYNSSCTHKEDVSVVCYGPDLNITDVRLADGTGPYDGRVEIEVNGEWGTICDRNFDINDADAFCNMLGSRAAQYFTGAIHGEGKGPVYIDELFCDALDDDLNDCPYVSTNTCGRARDVSVVCNGNIRTIILVAYPLDVTGIRLVNGNATSNGRVEIQSMETWGTICDDWFGMNEANTICRMLGIWPAVTYYGNARYGAGTGPIFVDDLSCGEDAIHINNCSYITNHNCIHDEDISVVCLDCGPFDSPVNGYYTSDNSTTFNSTVVFGCNENYVLVGENTMHCNIDGHWSSEIPSCVLKKQTNVTQVCTHGTISFGRRYNTPTPPKNVKYVEQLNRDILAPFYAHFNSAKGKVYYRSHDVLDSYISLKERNETKDIESKIRQFSDAPSSFEASFVLIVTWENMLPEDVDFDLNKSDGSTFQLVLVSNGEMTYSFYIYANGMMKWISKRPKYAPVWVGYHCKADTPFTFHNSFMPSVLELDKDAVHRGVSGVVFKPLVRAENSTKNNKVRCVTWYQENKHEKQHLDLMNDLLPQCPCDISLARWDPWFWHIERWNWYNNKTFTCVDMLPGRIYRPYGKSCCYDYKTSLWIDERPIAGGFYRYHPENKVDHYKHDIIPKEMCCSPLTPYCKYYYDMRPVGTCYRESPYNFGSFWGDPHFQTLDGLSYTFNGLGEYTLLQMKTGNKTFILQARTQRAVKSDGALSDATIFSAFAAMDEFNASFHVELKRAKNGFIIYGNGKDLTKQYNEAANEDVPIFDVPHGTLLISKRGQTLVVLFPSSGISLNVSINVEMLSLNSIVPNTFENLTTGLLGNYNGVIEDDFTLPNGTVLSANMTEREIFIYGQNWEIDGIVSAFVYPEGKNHSDYHNATFIPRFLDEAAPEKIKEAEVACNGSKNVECVFDYVFTESGEIARSTNQVKGNTDQTKSQMDEVMPQIIGCESINATYENIVSCPITIEDGTIVEFLSNNVNASFENDSSSIVYYQANNEPVDVRVVSINEQERSSTVFHMDVILCTGCSGNGVCTDIPRVDHRNTETFKYATCECYIDYEGPDCETLFDGCSEDPCSLNRDCHRLVGSNRTEWNRTYLCDACPGGYLGIDSYNDTCEDINECTMDNPPCDQECTNIDGSYECSCKFGYRPDPRNKDKCLDINECEDLNTPHDCSQNCTNTDGSFNCSCYKGYTFDSDSGNCSKDTETNDDPCSSMNCSPIVGGCRVADDFTAVCFCDRGYELYSNNSCIDINECDRNICSQKCNNTVGGFECSCFAGYTLMGKTTCQECDVGFWGENCENKCMCWGEGVKTCDHVKGCLCDDGWKGDTCQEDINECNEKLNAFNDPKKECFNTLGSFSYQCLEGFEKTTDDVCEDIDECNVPSLNGCDQICKNTVGSYICECEAGFTKMQSTCENINECELRTHDCEQICADNPGAYNCFCYFGYVLNDDRRTCTKLSDPCLALYDLHCSHYCYKSENSAECRCIEGFALGSDNQTCIDIDECTDDTHGCDVHADCKNTNGSYICDCPIGFKLQNDGRTCTECDDFHYGEDCALECACLHGDCNNILGCECNNGWQGNNCDVDINECTTGQVVCNWTNEQCVNTLGSAGCQCLQGYERDESTHCIDTDECADSRFIVCDQTCINLPGSYTCVCQTGFLLIDGSCQDIDECENKKSNCEQMCENTVGSYNCLCEDGFRLNLTDRESCIASSDCLNPEKCGNHSTCFHYNDEDICKCFTGFQNNSGMCEECKAGTYGDNCKQNCTCNDTNTDFCDHVSGDCVCKTGWEGLQCNKDTDECKNASTCPQHSTCINTDGSYQCDCDIGYYEIPSGLCSVCDNKHYGEYCLNECTCILTNTISCHHINGNCECMEGWTGDICSDDVDECDQIDNVCREKSNSVCSNTIGSYKCTCMEGFREIGDKCEDIDECIHGSHTCKYYCVNNEGSYTCECQTGYHGDGNNCTIVDECTSLVNTGECTSTDCVMENGVAVCKKKTVGLTLPIIIGIGGGSLLIVIAIVTLVVCIRRIKIQNNRKNRSSLPDNLFREADANAMNESKENRSNGGNASHLTSDNKSEATQKMKIPKVHFRSQSYRMNP
ncbi:hypothetical protein ACF0H5_020191 [Mactra antiquata]